MYEYSDFGYIVSPVHIEKEKKSHKKRYQQRYVFLMPQTSLLKIMTTQSTWWTPFQNVIW